MEFVETLTFWCPHVDRVACTNFNLRTVELRQPESREIFPFPFLLSPFPSFSLYKPFSFLFLSSFPFFPFCFSILVLFSHLISLSFSPIFLLLLEHTTHSVKGGNFLPFSSNHLCGHQISLFIPYFIIMTSSPTWLNVSHGILFPTHG